MLAFKMKSVALVDLVKRARGFQSVRSYLICDLENVLNPPFSSVE